MGNRNSVGSIHVTRAVAPLRVSGEGEGNEVQVTGSSSGQGDDIEGTEPFEIVVVPDTGADGLHQAQGHVGEAGVKLNCPTPSCPPLPASGVIPTLNDLRKGVAGGVGGFFLGGGSVGAALAADPHLDVGSKVVLSLVAAAIAGVGGYLTEHVCRSDN